MQSPARRPRSLRLVLGDQLTLALASLADADPAEDLVLMAEVEAETRYVPHHPQKIALVLAAMRHHAEALSRAGFVVEYVRLDAPGNSGTLEGEVARALARTGAARVVLTEPGEWRLAEAFRQWPERLGVPVEVRADRRFIVAREEFAAWAAGRRVLRMEHFYRDLRRRTGLLVEADGTPTGGRWNFDAENRRGWDGSVVVPTRPRHAPDAVTREVLRLVGTHHATHFGELASFDWPVTRSAALAALDWFIAEALPQFGTWQDAMATGEALLFHARLGAALNIGLLDPLEVCRRAVEAGEAGAAPLAAVEGFVRQILGWREFIRGVYWLHMPEYATRNALGATRPLPAFYWTGETDMACLRAAIDQTRRLAYAHHIQRLMLTGNFALLAGIAPPAVCEWYLAVYADAFEWVELPNTLGMALHADGGLVGSKPYCASGAYVKRMSDYCGGCRYRVDRRTGDDACPFNYLYWDFIARHEERFRANARMAMPCRTLARLGTEERRAIRSSAERFLEGL